MEIHAPEFNPHLARRMQRMVDSMALLNMRIARLAMAIGVSLQDENEVAQVMQQGRGANEHRRTSERRAHARMGVDSDRRATFRREELRALLVMRYDLTRNYTEQVGVEVTRQIMVNAQGHLTRSGFRPGADGIDINRLFDAL